jgi:hypothetical protein
MQSTNSLRTEMTDWFFHEQTKEYQRVWRQLSKDGNNPELDYIELIYTIVELYAKIDDLEARLNKDD